MNQYELKVAVGLMLCLPLGSWCDARSGERPLAGARTATPKRVVSLAPSVTETIFALGLGDRLVGVTTYCDYPAAAKRLPKIGGFMNPSLEAIVAKRPDLVIGVSGATDPAKAREMTGLGLRVNLISLSTLKDILDSIKTTARLLGAPAAGEALAGKIVAQIEDVKKHIQHVTRRSTLLVVGLRPLIAVGRKNFIDELITLAGGENIVGSASQPWLNVPEELVVAKAPQVIIEAGMGSERDDSNKRWRDLTSVPAVKEGRVYSYPSDKILRPGPRVGEALAEMARLIHPECFASRSRNEENRCEHFRP